MRFHQHPSNNRVLGAPNGWDQQQIECGALQISRKQVTARNAYEVERLYARLRRCDASETLRLLAELSEEGFHHTRVQRELTVLAETKGLAGLQFTARNGRIQAAAAELVAELHARLTA